MEIASLPGQLRFRRSKRSLRLPDCRLPPANSILSFSLTKNDKGAVSPIIG
jgi:hypothetical protein